VILTIWTSSIASYSSFLAGKAILSSTGGCHSSTSFSNSSLLSSSRRSCGSLHGLTRGRHVGDKDQMENNNGIEGQSLESGRTVYK
jgi:hypothetical protein